MIKLIVGLVMLVIAGFGLLAYWEWEDIRRANK